MTRILAALAFLAASVQLLEAKVEILEQRAYGGICDGSAGVALSEDYFAVANDEENVLRVYSRSSGGAPVSRLNLDRFLSADRKNPEADIEGAARGGELIYWITSHGRNKDGEQRLGRHRFFATRIAEGQPPSLAPYGQPYRQLLGDLSSNPALAAYNFAAASRLTPKMAGGLNIEGLCSGPNGSLWIGFRNPVPRGQALLIPLLNPRELVEKPGSRASFGPAVELNLEKGSIRDMVRVEDRFYIIAGDYDASETFELFQWDGAAKLESLSHWKAKKMNAEAILALPGRPNEVFILSDDGGKKSAGKKCRDLPEPERSFRGGLVIIE